jgi:hypothetical protein
VTDSAETHQLIYQDNPQAKHLTSSGFGTDEIQAMKQRQGKDHKEDQEDVAGHNGDYGENDTTSARLDKLPVEQSEGLEAQGTTSGDIGEMLKAAGNDLFDGVDEVSDAELIDDVADSELLDESPEVLRDHVLFRELGVGHDWYV